MLYHYETVTHILDEQHQKELAIQSEYQESNYTLTEPFVRLNPYGIAPLTALIMFHTESSVSVCVTIKGRATAGDFTAEFPETTEHYLPIYGLYADYENTVEIQLSNGQCQVIRIKTEPAPEKVKIPTYVFCKDGYMTGQLMFLSPTSPALIAGYDYAGDCRWYCTLNLVFAFKRFENGHIFVGTERLVAPPYNTTGLYEMSLLGKIYAEYRIPGGYHHDQFELEDGNILVLTQDLSRGTVEDVCVLIDRETGAVKKNWDYTTILPNGVGSFSKSPDGHDWFHNNAVWYDKKTDSLTLSGRNQDAVINIDYQTGALNWIIGDPKLWPRDMVDKYFFTPTGNLAEFEWPYGQHSSVVVPGGDVMILDNGCWRSKTNPNDYPYDIRYTRGVRYHIDREKRTIEQVWQLGRELGEKYFAPNVSNVDYYDEGHYMVHFGSNGFLHGKVCTKTPVAYTGEDAKAIIFNSLTVETKNDEVVYELHVPASYYRAKKLPLYTGLENVSFEKGKLLGNLMVTPETRMKVRAEVTGEQVPDIYQLVVVDEKDRIHFNATFETGETVQILLTDEAGNIHRYTYSTVPQRVLSMCVGTFKKEDPRNVDMNINKNGLKGSYQIQIVIADKLYETDVTVFA